MKRMCAPEDEADHRNIIEEIDGPQEWVVEHVRGAHAGVVTHNDIDRCGWIGEVRCFPPSSIVSLR